MDDDDDVSPSLPPVRDRSPLDPQDPMDAGEDSDDDSSSTVYGQGRGRRQRGRGRGQRTSRGGGNRGRGRGRGRGAHGVGVPRQGRKQKEFIGPLSLEDSILEGKWEKKESDCIVFSFSGPSPGPTLPVDSSTTDLMLFLRFFSYEVFNLIVVETNRFARLDLVHGLIIILSLHTYTYI